MQTLREIIKDAEAKKISVGHFNISETVTFKGIIDAAKELGVPVVIGTSEGERGLIGTYEAAAIVKAAREHYGMPIYLNADHTHSFDKVKEAVEAGYDAILFDGGKLPLEQNIAETKKVVEYIRSVSASRRTDIIVEGEMGYIGGGSDILTEVPKGAEIDMDSVTKPEDAARFVKETGVDLLAPAVGNLHGMFKDAPNPRLHIERIKEIRDAAGVPLVLHGGSGILDEDFLAAIERGMSVIHINTEIRRAWRKGMEEGFGANPDSVVPAKVCPPAVEAVKKVVLARLKLFSKL